MVLPWFEPRKCQLIHRSRPCLFASLVLIIKHTVKTKNILDSEPENPLTDNKHSRIRIHIKTVKQ